MLVVSWNIKGIMGLPDHRAAGILERLGGLEPDLVLLQEVGHARDQPERLRAGFEELGLPHFHHAVAEEGREPEGHPYGCAIASRWPLEAHDSGWNEAKWGELLARATVDIGGTKLEVVSAHIPNGSGGGWQKVYHFEALAKGLEGLKDRPTILGGDFNEPRIERPDGRWICWGEDERPDGSFAVWDSWEKHGIRDTGQRWDKAVRSVLADENAIGLRDACRTHNGPDAVATTHLAGGEPRFFDHILFSAEFELTQMGFEHAWREEDWSDHSAIWARLNLRG